ncbi:hypothetical protein FDUTEX481_07252 [Tolypothrix sp. PCC 7601]|nr:hypothetical protein FDUTEX481_07252 [Tolypothrix sp. PCC 7601]
MWGGHLVRPVYLAGKMPAPQDGIIYFLEIPYTGVSTLAISLLISQEKL